MTEVAIAFTKEQAEMTALAVKKYSMAYSEQYQYRCLPIVSDLFAHARKEKKIFFLTTQADLAIMVCAMGEAAKGDLSQQMKLYNYLRM